MLDGWYHTMDLGDGRVTRGVYDHRPVLDRYGFPDRLDGKRALDVGPGSGFFSFELERRGADVVAIDIPGDDDADWVPGAPRTRGPGWHRSRFELAREQLGSRVDYRPGSVYELDPAVDGTFDLVFCGSLLLHLLDPMRALIAIRSVTRELAIVETAADPALEAARPGEPVVRFGSRALEQERGLELGEVRTYWWMTGPALADMLRYAGFADVRLQPPFELPPSGHPVVVAHGRV